jgi:plasmid stability protein
MSHGLMLKLDDQTERLLRERASQDGVTIEEEARRLLGRALQSGWEAFWERAEKIQQNLAGRTFPDSADLLREDRER